MAKSAGDGHTLCGWKFSSAHSRMLGPPYRFIASLTDMLGCMMCEICLPTDRAISMPRYEAELSGDIINCTVRLQLYKSMINAHATHVCEGSSMHCE